MPNTDSNRTWTKFVKTKNAKKSLLKDSYLSVEFSVSELNLALWNVKINSLSFDGIFPEFLINIGPGAKGYILKVYNKILSTVDIPASLKKFKIIAFNKTGKNGSEANTYSPISLLSNCYKLLESLIYNRIVPVIDKVLPKQ